MGRKTIGKIEELYQDPSTWTGEGNLAPERPSTSTGSPMLDEMNAITLKEIKKGMDEAISQMSADLFKADPLLEYMKQKKVIHPEKYITEGDWNGLDYISLPKDATVTVTKSAIPDNGWFYDQGKFQHFVMIDGQTVEYDPGKEYYYPYGYLDHKGGYHAKGLGPLYTDGWANLAVGAGEFEDMVKKGLVP